MFDSYSSFINQSGWIKKMTVNNAEKQEKHRKIVWDNTCMDESKRLIDGLSVHILYYYDLLDNVS